LKNILTGQVFQAKVKFCLLVLAIWVPMPICGEEMNVFPWGFYAQDADSHTNIWHVSHCPCVLATEKYDQVPLYAIPKQGEVQPPTFLSQRSGLPKFWNHLWLLAKCQDWVSQLVWAVILFLTYFVGFSTWDWEILENCLSSVNSTNFAILKKIFAKILINKIEKENPFYMLICHPWGSAFFAQHACWL
jgi:hypothetical protein